MTEALYEYVYHNVMIDFLIQQEASFLSDCSLAMHLNSNLVFNDSGDRFAIKAQGLARIFSSAWSRVSTDGNFATPFYNSISSGTDRDIAAAAIAKMKECNTVLRVVDEQVEGVLANGSD